MKKILVLGATGHLGCYTALHLSHKGYEVIAVGHRSFDNGFFLKKNIKYIGNFSLQDENTFNYLPTDIDVVVHLAGAMPAHAGINPKIYIESITVGMVNLCEWIKNKTNCKRVIFNTTPSDIIAHFGGNRPVKDDVERSFPKDGGDHAIYAIAKNAACDIMEHYNIMCGISYCIFRHLTIYCYYPDPYYFINGTKKIVPWRLILHKILSGEDVEIWGNPQSLKELLYMKDFVRAVELSIESKCCGYFNLSGLKPYTLEEQIQGLIDVFGSKTNPSKKIYLPNKPSSPQNLLDSQKAKKVLGWTPLYSWIDACKDMKIEMKEEPMALLWGKNIAI